jgi:hypothetical protein
MNFNIIWQIIFIKLGYFYISFCIKIYMYYKKYILNDNNDNNNNKKKL